jgi:5,5'-dehydrodivanillate O-demethylase
MLSAATNEKLTRVGPGTPGGDLMRRYWFPIATTADVMELTAKAVRILGEDLTLFRDKSGRLGLITQRCPHRRVNLRLGIPEVEGIRCPYHGWMFDTSGQCVEMPAESPESTFASRVKVDAYPVEELGGLVFGYLGPLPAPELPRWSLFVADNVFRMIGSTKLDCNWLQCQENSIDQTHLEWDHGHWGLYALEQLGITDERRWKGFQRAKRHHTKIAFDRFEYGIPKYRLQEGEDEATSQGWNHGHPLVFSNMVHIGQRGEQEFQIRVPIDDTHTWHLVYHTYAPGLDVKVPEQNPVPVVDLPEWILQQDLIVWEEQDEIIDGSQEKLAESDKELVLYRKMLEEQIDVVRDGGEPMNVFREPHDVVPLGVEDYGDMSGYNPGDALYGKTGTVSGGIIREVDKLFIEARDAAKARG